MANPTTRRNPFYSLAAGSAGLFCLTILALLAASLGGSSSPAAAALERHAGWIITVEVTATLLTGLLALVVDRRFAPRDIPDPPQARPHDRKHQAPD